MTVHQLLIVWAVTAAPVDARHQADEPITVRAAFVRVFEQAEVPAPDRGRIQTLNVRLGQAIQEGAELARLEDSESRVAVEVAKLELAIAARQAKSDLSVQVAETAVREARMDKRRAELSYDIADRQLKGDVTVEQATKTYTVRRNALDRVVAARKGYRPSVSEAELEERQLDHDLSQLELRKAELEQTVAAVKLEMEKAKVEQLEASIERLQHEASVERDKQAVAQTTMQLKTQSLELAKLRLSKRSVRSPLQGEVVGLLRNRGEWVEAGTPIARVMRLDRLRVEGFVPAARGVRRLVGRQARIQLPGSNVIVTGVVTYVSAEVDSVNEQVAIHIEFDNQDLAFRPGESVRAVIPAK